MKKRDAQLIVGLSALAVVLSGCLGGGGGGGGPSPVGSDLRGKWSGYYKSPDQRVNLTATIKQEGNALTIETTKEGVGHLLTGTIDDDSYVFLTDAFDGETWTSYGEVSHDYLRIRDYFYDPELRRDSPEQDIYLSR